MGDRRVTRAAAVLTAAALLATGIALSEPPAPAAAAAPLACINTLYLSSTTNANVRRVDLTTGAIAPDPVFTVPATAGGSTNQLGIGADGAIAIVGTTTSVVEYAPEAGAAGSVSASPKTAGVAQGTMGAVNPLNGLYYYGSVAGGIVSLYVFDPATNAAPAGPVVTVPLTGTPGNNGDVAFDKTGRLYIVTGSASQAALYAVDGTVPTSGTGTTLTSRELSRGTTTVATNGIAFGSDGFLYLGGSNVLQKSNPITGAPTGTTFPLVGVSSTDLGSCANPSSARTSAGFEGPRAQPTDQVRVVLDGGSYGADGSGPDFPRTESNAGGDAAPSAPGLILPGETYTMRQEPVGTTDLADYRTTWRCTDGDGAVISSGTGNAATFTAPSGTDGANISCAFANALEPPTAVPDTGAATFGSPVILPGATNDRPGTGAIVPGRTSFTDPAATDDGHRLQTPDGVWTIGPDGGITFTPAPGFSGDAVTNYQIVDDNGQTATTTATATVRPGPTATADTAATTQGTSVQIPVLGNDAPGRNADGSAGTIAPASVLFEQGDQPAGAILSADRRRLEVPGEGVYTIDPGTGVVTFDPDPTFDGPTATPVSYGFVDSLGNPATATITVSVTAVGPLARNDLIDTAFRVRSSVDVSANDVPGPGGALVPTSVVFTDPAATDGGKSLVTPQGTWSINDDGHVMFAPADDFSGTATTPYRITDENGQSATATVSVSVPPGPDAHPDDATTAQNVDVTFPILDNDVPGLGPEGTDSGFRADSVVFVVTPALPSGSALSAGGRVLTVPGEGVYAYDPATRQVTFDPDPAFSGAATPVQYTVTDSFDNDTSSTIAVTVTPVRPVATGDAAKTPGATPVDIPVLANDDPGAASVPLVPSSVVFTSPDATDSGKTLVVPGEGTWTVRPDGSVRFSPIASFQGEAGPVRYSVADENGTRTTAEIRVEVGSGAIAAPDSAETRQNTPITFDILANDHASDLGDPCDPGQTDVPAGCDTGVFVPGSVVFPADGQPAGATVSADGRTITVPGEGAYRIDPTTAAVTFTPVPTFTGTATSIVYSARDSHGVPESSTITVTVVGVVPTALDDFASTPFDTPVTIDLLADDAPGHPSAPLVLSATFFPATGQPDGVTVSLDGTILAIDGQGVFVLDDAGNAAFRPADGFTGTTAPVAYRIVDTNGTTAEAHVQVTVRRGPSAAPDDGSTPQGTPVTVRPFANDTPSRAADDSAGAWVPDSLRFPTDGQPAGAQVLGGGTRLLVPGQGEYVAGADGSVVFTPEPAFTGRADPVAYSGVDAVGNAAASTLTILVTPVTPTAEDDSATTPFGTAVTFDVLGDDAPGDPTVPLDPDTLQFEASGIPSGLAAEIRDGGRTLDIAGQGVYELGDDGTVTFTPATGFSGTTTPVRYTVRDENGTPARAALTVTVRPGPLARNDAERTPQNVPVTVDVLANDRPGQRVDGSDGDLDPASVVFTVTGQPNGSTIADDGRTLDVPGQGRYAVGADGRMTFTPLADFRGTTTPVTYAVTDSLGNTASATVTITVAGVDPIARDNAARTAPGVPVVIDVVGDDSAGTDGAPLLRESLRLVAPDGTLVTSVDVPGEGVWRVVDGRIVFTPADGFSGRTTPITYSVADANGTRVTARITVTVDGVALAGALPGTGAAVPWITLIAASLLLALGGVLIIRTRRRSID